jgi:hypothetical protein
LYLAFCHPAFCHPCSSRPCQQKHWVAGHKHDCKKLRKQHLAAVKASAAAHANDGGVLPDSLANGSTNGHSVGSTERPEDSNSARPVPKQVLFPAERYAELAAAPPRRQQPLGLQNVGNRWVVAGLFSTAIVLFSSFVTKAKLRREIHLLLL